MTKEISHEVLLPVALELYTKVPRVEPRTTNLDDFEEKLNQEAHSFAQFYNQLQTQLLEKN